jgi:putative iron-regulated protein
MRFFRPTSSLLLLLSFVSPGAFGANDPVEAITREYGHWAHSQYGLAHSRALEFSSSIDVFLLSPNPISLQEARIAWIRMREAYSPTEVLRFYGGPIDGEGGPEALLNAWPLDEAFIDGVAGAPSSGFINDRVNFPNLDRPTLMRLNEEGGERNISLGYHALEFLLWGQDLDKAGPGNRSASDFILGLGLNADRRRDYLRTVTDILLDHLAQLEAQWNPSTTGSYGNSWQERANKDQLRKMLIGAFRLAGEELSHERMYVAYDTQAAEEEQSCFSDNTHKDHLENFFGIRQALLGGVSGGVVGLVAHSNPALALDLKDRVRMVEDRLRGVPAPFDQAIKEIEGRKMILLAIEELEGLAATIESAAGALGIDLR